MAWSVRSLQGKQVNEILDNLDRRSGLLNKQIFIAHVLSLTEVYFPHFDKPIDSSEPTIAKVSTKSLLTADGRSTVQIKEVIYVPGILPRWENGKDFTIRCGRRLAQVLGHILSDSDVLVIFGAVKSRCSLYWTRFLDVDGHGLNAPVTILQLMDTRNRVFRQSYYSHDDVPIAGKWWTTPPFVSVNTEKIGRPRAHKGLERHWVQQLMSFRYLSTMVALSLAIFFMYQNSHSACEPFFAFKLRHDRTPVI